MNWNSLQENVVNVIKSLDRKKVPYKEYALTYAENILAAIDEGNYMGFDTKSSATTQLTYVLSNLEGADPNTFLKINSLTEEFNIDLTEVIEEMLEEHIEY